VTSANSKVLPANRVRTGVQSPYTFEQLKNELLLRHDPKSKENSTRGIANDYGVTCGTIGRVLHGTEPHNAAIREKLGLPPLGLGVLCPVHGRVCAVQHRPPRPASSRPARPPRIYIRRPLNTVWPENTLDF